MYKIILCVVFFPLIICCSSEYGTFYIVDNADDFDNIIVKPKIITSDSVKSTIDRQRRNADRTDYANLDGDIRKKIFLPGVTTLEIEDWILVLEENKFISFGIDFTEKWTSNEDVKNETIDQDECQFLSGYVLNDPDSKCVITICHKMYYYGFFETGGRSYFVEPTLHPVDGHIVYKAYDSNNNKKKRCADCEVIDRYNLTADISLDDINYNFEDEETITEKPKIDSEGDNDDVEEEIDFSKHDIDGDVGYFIDTTVWQTRPHVKSSSTSKSKKRWLELALAVDYTIINFHGKNKIRQYLMALMNIVSVIYRDPSLDANLHLVIPRIYYYDDKKDSKILPGNAKKSLEAVNRWNYVTVRSLPKGEKPHDVAVWITREYIGGPSGYAPVAGVCDRTRSTALNKDEGLGSAFIIAHEVAHVLGLTHDGDARVGNTCEDEVDKGTIMSPTVTATFNRFAWSSCSKEEFHKQIKQWKCLLNPPRGKNHIILESTESYTYTMDEQCRMEHGEGYSKCGSIDTMDPCTYLWCENRNSSTLYCVTKKGQPVDGTECGFNKWCTDGYCQSMESELSIVKRTRKAIDGVWGPWSPWGQCSGLCGYGVQERYRSCNNPPPKNGGVNCTGESIDIKICKHQRRCWENPVVDVPAEYCSRLGSEEPNTVDWLPYDTDDEELKCYVNCISWGSGEVMRGGDHLPDGSPCSYDNEHHICIKGKCHKLGCDGIENSTLADDACGVCGGDGKSCINKDLVFQKIITKDMTTLVVLRRYSRDVSMNVTIHPSTESNHILADSMFSLVLKGKASNYYKLSMKDSHNSVQALRRRPGPANMIRAVEESAIVVGGALIKPSRTPGTLTLTTAGPLNTDLWVMISAPAEYLQNVEAAIQLNYTLPGNTIDSPYVWMVRECHCGVRPLGPFCVNALRPDQVVDSYKCPPNRDISLIKQDCYNMRCEFHWVTGEWEYCSATCGDNGIQHRQIYCVPITVDNATLGDKPWVYMVEPSRCSEEKPVQEKSCNRVSCPAHWIEEAWTECSVSCGMGFSMRPIKCSNADKRLCGTTPPTRWQTCRRRCGTKKCTKDKSIYCALPQIFRYCVLREFEKLCCVSCNDATLYQDT